jgi:hypothetical protein
MTCNENLGVLKGSWFLVAQESDKGMFFNVTTNQKEGIEEKFSIKI